MPLEPGSSVGPYTIDREIGRGGMGVVYLAHDPRLSRDVAIKSLPEHLANDPERLERFQGEARALAQLNHPAVAGIHGLEEHEGQHFLVLEYVPGETLADRLEGGPMGVEEAIELCVRIADGIEAAHEAGVIHRDLKPENIRVTPTGEVKVLDFGLAKVQLATSSEPGYSATQAATRQPSPTLPGAVMGTAAYMSPEQARGRGVDKRTDIWAFGVLLYECLTGASPFAGESASDSIGAVLHKEVDLGLLPASTPATVRHVLARCLARDKRQRYRDIGDVRLELELLDREPAAGATAAGGSSRRPLLAVGALALVAAAGWAMSALRPAPGPPPPPSLALDIALPAGLEVDGSLAISDDGRTVAFAGKDDEGRRIYLRALDDPALRIVPRSEDGMNPTLSPDGKWVLFHTGNAILRAPVDGGPPAFMARADYMTADWADDDTIVFSTGLNSPLMTMPSTGGTATPLTDLADDEAYAHVWPQRIPGTRQLLFTSWASGSGGGARILDLDSGEQRSLDPERTGWIFTPPARWAGSGHLLFEAWDDGLLAVPFDPARRDPVSRSDASLVLAGVAHMGNTTHSKFDLTPDGTLVYVPGQEGGRRLVWVDPTGQVEEVVSQAGVRGGKLGRRVRISPDGTKVATGGGTDLVVVDLARGIPRTIEGEGNDLGAVWAPDGRGLYFSSNRDQRWSVWYTDLTGTDQRLVLQREENVYLEDVAGDGTMLIGEQPAGRSGDLYLLSTGGELVPLAVTDAVEGEGDISPDGRWVAYESDLSGRFEIYVVPADGSAPAVQVTTGGGAGPRFSPSGRELHYRRHRSVWRVGMAGGKPVGDAEQVFNAPRLDDGTAYDITAVGGRMLAVQLDEESIPDGLRVVTNFFDRIRAVAGPGSRD